MYSEPWSSVNPKHKLTAYEVYLNRIWDSAHSSEHLPDSSFRLHSFTKTENLNCMLLSLEYSSCMHMILIICTFSCMKNSFHSRLLWSQYVIILLNNWSSRAPAILLGHVQNHLLTQQIVNIFVRFLCSLCFNLYVHFISKLIMLLYSSCPKSAEDQCRFHSHRKVWWLLNLDSFVQLNLAAKVYNFAYKF